jgi:hypothetical protein
VILTGEDDRRARPGVSVLPPVMENSQDKVAGEGFGADDGAAGVVSLPVPGYTPPVSGSSPPVTSEGGVTPFFLFSFFLPLFFFRFFSSSGGSNCRLILCNYFVLAYVAVWDWWA